MLKNFKKQNEGFTIIEVLIVLAIAGLIMLIVFLAVPALNRNSRNTTYRSEASQLLSAVTEFSSNSNGSMPAVSSCSAAGNPCTASPATLDAQKVFQLTKNKTITELEIAIHAATNRDPSFNKVWLITGAKCGITVTGSGNSRALNTTTGPGRAVALIYAVEDSNGEELPQCNES